MGGSLTVCNKTNVPLHVSLDQIGPLCYENWLMPGQCMQRNVGRVWFTINAALATPWNEITDIDCAMAIITTVANRFGTGVRGSLAKSMVEGWGAVQFVCCGPGCTVAFVFGAGIVRNTAYLPTPG